MTDIAINIKATDNASPNIKKVGDAFNGVEKQVKQAKVATETFSNTLAKGIIVFEVLRVGFEVGKKAFEFLSKNSEDFGKTMESVKGVIEKIANVFVSQLAPAIEGVVKWLDQLFKQKSVIDGIALAFTVLSTVIKTIIDAVGGALKQVFDTLKTQFDNIFNSVGQSIDAFQIFGGIMQYVSSAIKIVGQNISSLINIVGSVVNAYIEAGKTIGAFADLITGKINWDQFKNQAINAGKAITNVYGTAVKEVGKVITTVTGEIGNFVGGSKKIAETAEKNYVKIKDQVKKTMDTNTEVVQENNEKQAESTKQNVEKQLTAWQAFQEKFGKTISGVNAILQESGKAISSVMNSIFSALANDSANQLKTLETNYKELVKSIDTETQKRLESMGLADQTEVEKAQEKYDKLLAMNEEYNNGLSELQETQLDSIQEKIVGQSDKEIEEAIRKKREKESNGNQEALNESRKELEKQKILEDSNKKKEQAEKEYLKKKSDIEKQAFETKKANDIAQVWISTALGVAGAWASAMSSSGNPIVGAVIAAIATTALLANAGVQTGIISSQTYTPAFESGGIVPGSSYSGDRVTAMVNSGEMILNKDQQANLFDIANSGGGGEQYVNIYIDSEMIMQRIITGRKFAEVR